jgi:hypothetical protein
MIKMKKRRATTITKDTFLIVGNGISIDFSKTFSTFGLHPSRPLSNLENQEKVDINYFLKYIPDIENLLLTVNNKMRDNHFEAIEEYFNSILDTPDFYKKETQLQNFLMVLYGIFQKEANMLDYSEWKWTKYFNKNAERIALVASFNYDLLLETAIKNSNNTYNRLRSNESPGDIKIFKPHGSIDFDLSGLIGIPNFDPRIHEVYNNNSDSVTVISSNKWKEPRMQVDIIPPNSTNYHRNKRAWIDEGYKESLMLLKQNRIKHVIIAGHSYGQADREEINELINNITFKANFYFVNPYPAPQELEDHIKKVHKHHNIYHINPLNSEEFNEIFNLKKYFKSQYAYKK